MPLANLNIRSKFILILSLPLLGMLTLGLWVVGNQARDWRQMTQLEHVVQLSEHTSKLLLELQRERGRSAGFLASAGQQFDAEMRAQREQTNGRLQPFQQFLQHTDFTHYGSGFVDAWSAAQAALAQLSELRDGIDRLQMSSAEGIDRYSRLNEGLLNAIGQLEQARIEHELSLSVRAYINTLRAGESAGVERATLSAAFSADRLPLEGLVSLVTLFANQNTYLDTAIAAVSGELKAHMQQALNAPENERVFQLRQVAVQRFTENGFGIDPAYWFNAATARIDLLNNVAGNFSAALQSSALQLIQGARNTLFLVGIGALIVLISASLLSFFISRSIAGQLFALHGVIDRVDRQQDLKLQVEVHSHDELGQTAQAFNRMLEKFQSTISHMRQSATQLAAAAEELSVTTEQTHQGMQAHRAQTDQVAVAMTEMASSVQEVAHNTIQAAQAADAAEAEGGNSNLTITEAISSIDVLERGIVDAANVIAGLADESEQIGSVLDVIHGIAEQTNLLALNAAIEAARAGEQGRGFAVVADEVRTLANRTRQSTQEIHALISALQNGAQQAVEAIEDARQHAANSVDYVEKSVESQASISGYLGTIASMNQQIATAADQQRAVAEEINGNIANISQVTDQTVEGASQIAAASDELARLAGEMLAQVAQFKA